MIRAAICFILAGLPCVASAQPGGTARGAARADVVRPMSIEPAGDLQFGSIAVMAGRGGSVTVDPRTGAATYNGAARPVCAGGDPCNAAPALFVIRGDGNRRYRLTLPETVIARSADAPGTRLRVDGLSAFAMNGGTSGPDGVLDADGRDRVQVGGTLRIPVGTPPGRYAARILVVATYS
ncbi:MAG: DUF4402 domain-containing protein [Pontixanthobacter sp.]